MVDKYKILGEVFGHSEFRNGQAEIIDALSAVRDVLAVMPTGGGKSVCYQIPALMCDGITIVVSPLISLMKDQVMSLVQSGVRAEGTTKRRDGSLFIILPTFLNCSASARELPPNFTTLTL